MRRRVSIVLSVAVAALVFTAAAWALRFTDESYFTPVGAVGSPYSFAFGGAGAAVPPCRISTTFWRARCRRG